MDGRMEIRMTFASSRNTLFRTAGALVLGLSLIATPVVAGNGNGNGSGNAGSNAGGNKAGNASNKSSSAGSNKSAAATGKNTQGVTARSYGKLNGFMHASPTALANAAPTSAIGKVAVVYAGLLSSYLAPADDTTAPAIEDVAAALADATNKPLTPDIIAAVNQKLLATDATLASSLTTSGKTPEDLAQEIANALGV